MESTPSDIEDAFRNIDARDIIVRFIARGQLERAGLGKQNLVGGRFVTFYLTDAGRDALAKLDLR